MEWTVLNFGGGMLTTTMADAEFEVVSSFVSNHNTSKLLSSLHIPLVIWNDKHLQ